MRIKLLSKQALKRTILVSFIALTLVIISLIAWIIHLDQQIAERFAQKRFGAPIEFYSAPEVIYPGTSIPFSFYESFLSRHGFVQRNFGQRLNLEANPDGSYPGAYSVWNGDECRSVLPEQSGNDVIKKCLAFLNSERGVLTPSGSLPRKQLPQILAFGDTDLVLATYAGDPPSVVASVSMEPELFAQYYGDKPTLRKVVSLSEAPNNCINALLAIEDSSFWEHSGFSLRALARAVVSNVTSNRGHGGSTITQQLVKNYFLTDERTLKRKIVEFVMAVLVEARAGKEDILWTYINLIYMGANGSFQVRGFGAASEHYFGTPFADLNLEQCALLASIVNSPGLFNPFTKPENATKRRSLVLNRMAELKMIDASEAEQGKKAPLPKKPPRGLSEPAPFFVQAVRRLLTDKKFDEGDGLRVYTSLNLRAQEAAYQAVRNGLDQLEKNFKNIQKLKTEGKNLEAILLSADPNTGHIQAVVGGRAYQGSPFNRAIDSHRQVGSVMKPLVFLTALEGLTPEGSPYTPISILKDEEFTHKYQGQTWSPRNYDGTFNGDVPMYYALKESLNAATATLGLNIGLENIVDISRRLGITSKMEPVPSLTLGAFELHPREVLQAYGALSKFGSLLPLTFLIRVENLSGETLFENESTPEQVVTPETTAQLVSILKQTMISGTGRFARLSGFVHPSAGKTGTTNDKKDAWFAGFTPYHTAVVWVGYDDNTPHNLTGASGAVPIWTSYMKGYASSYPNEDFKWPDATEVATFDDSQLSAMGVPHKGSEPLEPVQLVFRKGQAPLGTANPAGSDYDISR